MYVNTISQYLSLIKQKGLAINNLYMLEVGIPDGLYSTGYITTNIFSSVANQSDAEKNTNSRTGLLDGLINVKKYLGSKANSPVVNEKSFFDYNVIEKVCMLCTSAELPFYKQKVNNTFYNHMTHKMVTGLDTDSINLTFYVDKGNDVLLLFQSWQELINNSLTDYEGMVSYKNEYAAKEIVISLINKTPKGELVKYHSAVLLGAFPSYIRPIRVNNGTSELIQLEVTFEYDKIRHHSSSGSADEDLAIKPPIATGLNLLDIKNQINDIKSQANTMINNVRNDVKNVSGEVSGIGKGISNLFN